MVTLAMEHSLRTLFLLTSIIVCEGDFINNRLLIDPILPTIIENPLTLPEIIPTNPTIEIGININLAKMEPEAYMTTLEIIQNRGYPGEAHTVQTKDGYLLELHRIPYGRSGPSANRQPVFLQHGLFSQSGDWIVNFGNQSLGYMLADSGYDVWLGNYRGNTYSRKHVSLDPDIDSEKFWNFSFQEHGNYDLSACIDYVLQHTGYQNLSYVGHSMGTTGFFLLMSNRTEYNAKINKMVALAPVALFTALPISERGISQVTRQSRSITESPQYFEFLSQSNTIKLLANVLCNNPAPVLCVSLFQTIGGIVPDLAQVNKTRLAVYAAHTPAGASSKTLYHYLQLLVANGFFRAYDYGPIGNSKIYNQTKPPEYDLGKVTVRVALFWGLNDRLTTAADVKLIAKALPNVVLDYKIPNHLWHHIDFIWAIEAELYQNQKVVEFLKSG